MAKTGSVGHWLVKSEPGTYAWGTLVKDKKTRWDGVRNFEARNNLRAMKAGDLALFYHSTEGKEIVGVATIVREAYADPTADAREDWTAVDLAPAFPLAVPVTLATIKDTPALADIQLLRRSRLSVVPISPTEFDQILKLGKTSRGKRSP